MTLQQIIRRLPQGEAIALDTVGGAVELEHVGGGPIPGLYRIDGGAELTFLQTLHLLEDIGAEVPPALRGDRVTKPLRCEVCTRPVLWGSRHPSCGSFVREQSQRVAALEQRLAVAVDALKGVREMATIDGYASWDDVDKACDAALSRIAGKDGGQ